MDLLRLTVSVLKHWSSTSKYIGNIWGGTELSGIRETAVGAAFSQTEVLAETIVSFSEPSSHRAGRQVPYLILHKSA